MPLTERTPEQVQLVVGCDLDVQVCRAGTRSFIEAKKAASQTALPVLRNALDRVLNGEDLSAEQVKSLYPEIEAARNAGETVRWGWLCAYVGYEVDLLEEFTRYVESAPSDVGGWDLLSHVANVVEETTLARSAARRAIELSPNCPELYFQAGHVEINAGDREEAARLLQRALELDPDEPHYPYVLALIRADTGEFMEAVRLLRKAHDSVPESLAYRYLLARSYLEAAHQDWVPVPESVGGEGAGEPRFTPRRKEQLDTARELLEDANRVGGDFPDLHPLILRNQEGLAELAGRHFSGNWAVLIAALGLGLLMVAVESGSPGTKGSGVFYMVTAVLYFFASRTPQWRLNLRFLEGKRGTGTGSFLIDNPFGEGLAGLAFAFCVVLVILPLAVIWNGARNYVFLK